ncbi:ABC transporter ATP-binding protein [Pedobacter hartonius]|uniref:Iron complex transport system ATP-binding protein n=1 Tax=Pedobacter hartonius TaxID=425514 RepID=A0A1H4ARF2_9SPHI|nr:ABC transporter ATP-binding protein [Pedobacter hartonius]SEA38525.1 iron complex transport system ATP-binding protein [Pedobacter hartonius]
MEKQQAILHTTALTIGYHPGTSHLKVIAGPLNLSLYAGQLICLLGPNGCGKSTLLRTVSGLQKAVSGNIQLEGKDLKGLKPADIARQISLVLTDNVRSGNLDVYSLISLGRYPYSGWLGILNQTDKTAIDYAIDATGTAAFLNRKMDSLSDGECQKVMLARAIAQDTPLIILDEPTAHLDLPSRIQLMRLLHQLAKETGKAILISTHELDLALQVADQIWLMDSGGHLAAGLPEELILDGSFQQAFDKDGLSFDAATGTFHIHHPRKEELSVTGEGTAAFWTRKALIRKGYAVTPAAVRRITVSEEGGLMFWLLDTGGDKLSFNTLSSLLHALDQPGIT